MLRLAARGLTTREIAEPLHLAQDRRPPHPARLHEDRRVDPGRRRPLGDAARRRLARARPGGGGLVDPPRRRHGLKVGAVRPDGPDRRPAILLHRE
ncbi:MAG: hypothetical protein ACXWYN_11110, partial [Actinomycetota bacterium]